MNTKRKTTSAKCIFCGGELSWDSQEEASQKSDDYNNDEEAMIYFLRCRKCGRDYEIIDPVKEERDNQFKEYWND